MTVLKMEDIEVICDCEGSDSDDGWSHCFDCEELWPHEKGYNCEKCNVFYCIYYSEFDCIHLCKICDID